jgi:hypothetical protein
MELTSIARPALDRTALSLDDDFEPTAEQQERLDAWIREGQERRTPASTVGGHTTGCDRVSSLVSVI